jgi:hypothetical protein
MPRTLTRSEFLAHPVGQKALARGLKPQQAYSNYLSFVSKRRAQRADPFAPLSENTLAQRVRHAVGAQTDPLIAQINREAGAQSATIDQSTRARAESLRGVAPVVSGAFGRAEQATAGVGDVLSEHLAASGNEAGRGLRDVLAQMNAPEALVNQVAGGVEGLGQGAANTEFALQSGVLRDLLARGAEAETYAGLLPAFAQSEGAQAQQGVRSSADKSIADIRSKIPSAVASLLGEARNQELQKAIARQGFGLDQAKLGQRQQEQAFGQAATGERLRQSAQRLELDASKTGFNQALSASKLKLSQQQYNLAVKREGRLEKPSKKGGFTPAQRQNFSQIAFESASDAYAQRMAPVEVLRDLIASGVPFTFAIRALQRFARTAGAPANWKATLGWTKGK